VTTTVEWQELVLERLGDLAQQQQRTLDKLDELRDATVPRPEFEAYKIENDRRHKAADDRLAVLAQEKGHSHGTIQARIDKIEEDRKSANRWTITTALTAAVALAGVIGGATGAW